MSRVSLAAGVLVIFCVFAHAQRGMRGFGGGGVATGRAAPAMSFAGGSRAAQRAFSARPSMMARPTYASRLGGMARPRTAMFPQRRVVYSSAHTNGGSSFHTRGFESRRDSDHRDRDSDHRFHRRHYYSTFPYYYGYWPLYYSDYWDPYYSFGSYTADSSSYDASPNTGYYNDLSNRVGELDSEVQQLRDENDSLRSTLDQQYHPAAPAKPAVTAGNEAATVLIFRDGHRSEVQNYAIIGSTLWLLSATRATKMPLSTLDLDQTVKANEDRGINFEVPK